jgi:hypothetical protein
MATLTLNTDFFVKEASPQGGIVTAMVSTKNTVDATNTLAITLSKIGISATGLIGVYGWKHTTDNSVSAREFPTTSVTAGVLTLTVPSGTDNDPRFYLIIGASKNPA